MASETFRDEILKELASVLRKLDKRLVEVTDAARGVQSELEEQRKERRKGGDRRKKDGG